MACLIVAYRLLCGSASLGAVTALPIVLVSALVIGGMWVFGVPLSLLTALLLSLVIGVGIDYNIHVTDRFVQERERGRSVQEALVNSTTGTGGALLEVHSPQPERSARFSCIRIRSSRTSEPWSCLQ